MTQAKTLQMLTSYKRWANQLTFAMVDALPPWEALKPRQTRFCNMVLTLSHVFVVDDIFRAHLKGKAHSYTARNVETTPSLDQLRKAQAEIDDWYVATAQALSDEQVSEKVRFKFVGGGEGEMTRGEMILHVVNHGTYHRGFVGDMVYQAGGTPPANDLTVWLRDAAPVSLR